MLVKGGLFTPDPWCPKPGHSVSWSLLLQGVLLVGLELPTWGGGWCHPECGVLYVGPEDYCD